MSSIVLMNHRTRLDWMFYFCVLYRMPNAALTSIKIILKAGFEKIPGLGWAMQLALFIFIKRKWEQDSLHLSMFVKYFHKIQKRIIVSIHIYIYALYLIFNLKSRTFIRHIVICLVKCQSKNSFLNMNFSVFCIFSPRF